MRSGGKVMYSRVTTGPAVEPIGLEDIAKLDLKVTSDDDDDLLELLIQAAREYVEEETGLSFITQTRKIMIDGFPQCDSIYLTNGPLQSVTSVTYQDADDETQTMASSGYWVDTHSRIPRIVVKESWPETKLRPNAVTIEYKGGYGDAATSVPAALKKAILIVLGWMYENRDQPVPHGLISPLISPYVVTQDVSY